MNVLEEWLTETSTRLGLDEGTGAAYRDLVLELARDVAHGVARPAAPLTTFLLGLAAGRAGGSAEEVTRLSAEVSAAAEAWAQQHPAQD
ncbi:MAG: hypothetical protein QOI76_1631 [Frankiales bacterium]|nr:hypothetical protein [Frankiales bacterium]